MIASSFFWFFLTFICIIVQGLYAMLEMASVSFNRVRLQYYVSQGNKRAIWLSHLLKNPSRLFGTTLLMVNLALQIGSECSRQFYHSFGLIPDFAIFTQVILVLIFAELSPMFAARNYSEHVIMLGIPLLYATSRIMAPIVDVISWISIFINYLFAKNKTEENIFLTREEVQKVLEQKFEQMQETNDEQKEFNHVVNNIFVLQGKTAQQIMEPITTTTPLLTAKATIKETQKLLKKTSNSYALIYQGYYNQIIGIAFSRDLIAIPTDSRVQHHMQSPIFVAEDTPIITLLHQFRHGNLNIVIVLNPQGQALGLIQLHDILDEIFDPFCSLPLQNIAIEK